MSLKLCIAVRAHLEAKYSTAGMKAIDAALNDWIAADRARGFNTQLVFVDRADSTKPFKVAALKGKATANKIKRVLDRLVKKAVPDYIVLLGSDDVVPHFRVPNPTKSSGGDTDPEVPTDNPYACSTAFISAKRATYLVPDRVVGRIPDVPGSSDPAALLAALAHATGWISKPASAYAKQPLSVCCATWKGSGLACVKELGGASADLLVSPPVSETTGGLKAKHKSLRHFIKCHGQELDARFYGEGSSSFPVALSARALAKRVKPGTVAAAVCCYGAGLFDPASPLALQPGDSPLPLVYLGQGAHGFFGSTTLAWVGSTSMLCADWVTTAFLKHATSGASLGRATLEAKQDLLRWLQQQGQKPDRADEKTLLQFILLGDPSIHPVQPTGASAAPTPAGPVAAAASPVIAQRRERRLMRAQLGAVLREGLPKREAVASKTAPATVRAAARAAFKRIPRSAKDPLVAQPTIRERVTRRDVAASLASAATLAIPGAKSLAKASMAGASTFQYCWIVPLKAKDGIRRIGMVTVEADAAGRVTFERVVVSS